MMIKDLSIGILILAASALLIVAEASAQTIVERTGSSGFRAFGGIYKAADNPVLVVDGLAHDKGRDIASIWMTYRWKDTARSAASCEVNLDRLDHQGFHNEMPDQEEEDRKLADFYNDLPRLRIGVTHNRLETASRDWGALTLRETISENDTVGEQYSSRAVYVAGPYTYEMKMLCGNAPERELRALAEEIDIRNITQE